MVDDEVQSCAAPASSLIQVEVDFLTILKLIGGDNDKWMKSDGWFNECRYMQKFTEVRPIYFEKFL